jgi:hypothetical protein
MYRGLPIDVRLVDVRFIGMDVRWLRWARLPGVALALKNGVTPAWSLPGLLDGRQGEPVNSPADAHPDMTGKHSGNA